MSQLERLDSDLKEKLFEALALGVIVEPSLEELQMAKRLWGMLRGVLGDDPGASVRWHKVVGLVGRIEQVRRCLCEDKTIGSV